MKRAIFLLVLPVLCMMCGCGDSSTNPGDSLPSVASAYIYDGAVGDVYHYDIISSATDTLGRDTSVAVRATIKILERNIVVDGRTGLKYVTAIPGELGEIELDTTNLVADEKEILMYRNTDNNTDFTRYFAAPISVGTTFKMDESDELPARIVAVDKLIAAPAGQFRTVQVELQRVEEHETFSYQKASTYHFAPNRFIVESVERTERTYKNSGKKGSYTITIRLTGISKE